MLADEAIEKTSFRWKEKIDKHVAHPIKQEKNKQEANMNNITEDRVKIIAQEEIKNNIESKLDERFNKLDERIDEIKALIEKINENIEEKTKDLATKTELLDKYNNSILVDENKRQKMIINFFKVIGLMFLTSLTTIYIQHHNFWSDGSNTNLSNQDGQSKLPPASGTQEYSSPKEITPKPSIDSKSVNK